MNLATPAPEVEPAVATTATPTAPATATSAPEEEAAVAAPPPIDNDPDTPPIIANDDTSKRLTVEMLRANGGAEFEAQAAILPGAPPKNILKRWFPIFFDERDFVSFREVKKYCLVQEDTCYVYTSATAPAPLYALPLARVRPLVEPRDRLDPHSVTISPLPDTNQSPPYMVTVLLKDAKTGKQVHQFTFNTSKDPALAQQFYECVLRIGTTKEEGAAVQSQSTQQGKKK